MTYQPEWVCVANLGDVNYLDHGGYFVFVDSTGIYDPEGEHLAFDYSGKVGIIHRFALEQMFFASGMLVSLRIYDNWLAGTTHLRDLERYKEWFSDDAVNLDLVDSLCSSDPRVRATAYLNLGNFHGLVNFDQYPLELTREELKKRYKELICTNTLG